MHTRCPHCDTCFRVTPEHLELAKGAVRCGRCFNTFNARDYLIESPKEEENDREAPPPPEEEEKETPTAPPLPQSEPKPEPEPTANDDTQRPDKNGDDNTPAASDHSLDVLHEIENRSMIDKRRSGRRTVVGLLVIVALTVTLIGQYLYANRASLAQSQDARPWLAMVCAVAGCDVPLPRAPKQIKLVDRDIRSHPQHDNALLVEAEMVNEAPFAQAYPTIKLTLLDITGKIISGRSFTPEEYLPKRIDQKKGMASNIQLKVALVLVDPGDEAVGFEFEFL